MSRLPFTADQKKAYEAFYRFLFSDQQYFVIRGYSGTGKSTLLRYILEDMDKMYRARQMLSPDKELKAYAVNLTATTNKAAENLQDIIQTSQDFIKGEVRTIYSLLGLQVVTDYRNGKTVLKDAPKRSGIQVTDELIIIDESSYVDTYLLGKIRQKTIRCKIVFVGDPAQLLSVGSTYPPVFKAGFPETMMKDPCRFDHNSQINELSAAFRDVVEGGEFFQFFPDNESVNWLNRGDFENQIIKTFSDPAIASGQAKILAWRNATVNEYNHWLNANLTGNPNFKPGDYVVCNKYLRTYRGDTFKTDSTHKIASMVYEQCPHTSSGLWGHTYTFTNGKSAFMPEDRDMWKQYMKQCSQNEWFGEMESVANNWIDLRLPFACTVDKSQGSTYQYVFIDLDDLARCPNANQMARMLYVGTSRASVKVYLTGDLV